MKNKQLLFLVIFCILLTTPLFSQQQSKQTRFDSAPEPERRRWELGIDVLNIINGNINSVNLAGATYKQGYFIVRRYSMENSSKSALEMKFGIYTSNYEALDLVANGLDRVTQTYNLTIGYEFQQQQGRFMLIYGPQIKGIINSNTINSIITNPSSANEYNSSELNGTYISGGGFIGARFFFNSRLSASVTTSLEIGFDESKTNTKIFDFTSKSLIQEGNATYSNTEIRGGLLTAQIGFHF